MGKFCNYKIVTDITCDLPFEYYEKNNIICLELTYSIDNVEYTKYTDISIKEFYDKMRNGSVTKTAQIPPDVYKNAFENILNDGYNIIYLAFSSGLSGGFNNARFTAESLSELYPERKIAVIDSLCASLGEGLLLAKAVQLRDNGASFEEVTEWIESHKLNLVHLFTVDDLMFLHRGGRVSKASAIAGSLLGIKPVLHVDNEGHLIPISKVRGRKQALTDIVDRMEKLMGDHDNSLIAISHGDCLEDAEFVASLIKKRLRVKNIIINHVGMVIGSHSGPGTIALFFEGDNR